MPPSVCCRTGSGAVRHRQRKVHALNLVQRHNLKTNKAVNPANMLANAIPQARRRISGANHVGHTPPRTRIPTAAGTRTRAPTTPAATDAAVRRIRIQTIQAKTPSRYGSLLARDRETLPSRPDFSLHNGNIQSPLCRCHGSQRNCLPFSLPPLNRKLIVMTRSILALLAIATAVAYFNPAGYRWVGIAVLACLAALRRAQTPRHPPPPRRPSHPHRPAQTPSTRIRTGSRPLAPPRWLAHRTPWRHR